MTGLPEISRYVTLLLIIFLCLDPASNLVKSQSLSGSDLSNVRVSELTDDQILQFVRQAEASGMSEQELEAMALSRGMPASEIVRLRARIRDIQRNDSDKTIPGSDAIRLRSVELHDTAAVSDPYTILGQREHIREVTSPKIFGSSLFRSERLTFEPSLNIPTPKNYQLGPGDELVIDVWGASQELYRLTVSPEGSIQIRGIGPVQVNGLSIEAATERIISRLSSIYSGLRPAGGGRPNTFAQVTLGNVRSIKVSILGEVNTPGTYTVSSLATVFNALYVSGGPSDRGSFRNIQVLRDNQILAVLDVYDFLVDGEQTGNVRLQDQDIVRVSPYKNRVEVSGEVIRNGLFEVSDNETLADLIRFAGGFTDKAYRHRLKVYRNTPREQQILDVAGEEIGNFFLEPGDRILVDRILDRFENRVEIRGAVYRPGEFELDQGLTLMGLIDKAEGLREDAFTGRAILFRTRPDFTVEAVQVDLSELIQNPRADIPLVREDIIRIASIFDLKEEHFIQITGEVRDPGTFPFVDNLTLQDAIFLAGGFRESATSSRIEIARRITNADPLSPGSSVSELFYFNIDRNLGMNSADSEFQLNPFDRVFVRRSPGYEVQQNVRIEGEVLFPGSYSIRSKEERISDLVTRAGGLTAEAYIFGASLIREDAGRVGIDLSRILTDPGSRWDLYLQAGDVLRIPMELQTVRIRGEVNMPVSTRYERRQGFRSYISRAGGFTDDARRRRAYVVYPNGDIEMTRRFLAWNLYPSLEPGSEIVVPAKAPRNELSTQERIAIFSAIVSMSAIVVNSIYILSR